MGAFCTGIFRAGVISIGGGQWQAGRALGMTHFQLLRRIVLPQAVRRMVPPLVNQSITQLKNTALLYVVAVPGLMYTRSIVPPRNLPPPRGFTHAPGEDFFFFFSNTLFAQRPEGPGGP